MDITHYSKKIGGDRGNYKWPTTFDLSDSGYLGISQTQDHGVDRVLLCPKQVKELLAFIHARKAAKRRT